MMRFVALAVLCSCVLMGQNVSSTVRATVLDSSGGAITNAECVLRSPGTGAQQRTTATSTGTCTFGSVLPGTYTLTVSAPGFKSFEMTDLIVSANEVRAIPNVVLQVGAVQESVSVTAEAAVLQTESAERSGLITGSQIQNLALRGRDFFALLSTIPGVVDDGSQRRETTSPNSIQGTFINGQRDNQKNFTVDGIASIDTGSNYTVHFQPNMDAIQETRILTSNYQAEYGRNAGGVVSVITKSGTRDFHGTGYYFYRHESLNANSFFNNRSNTPKQPYRYRINGYTIGGPVYIPKVLQQRERFFFFWSQEFVGMRRDAGTRFATVPTELERRGDFSQTVDTNGQLIPIRDPLAGQPFPGNLIPQSRINPTGRSILGFLPLPNFTDPDPRLRYSRNFRSVYSGTYPRRSDMIRGDAHLTDTLRVYYRFMQDSDEQKIPWGSWTTGAINFLATPTIFGQPGKGHVVHATKTVGPSLVNETIFGKSYNKVYFHPEDPAVFERSRMGNPPQWYPDPYIDRDYIPNVTFGAVPANAANITLGNIPYLNYNDIYSLVNNTSKVTGGHNIKAGFYLERTLKFAPNFGAYRGTFNFGRDANNPLDSGHGFSNALLGNFASYSEATKRVDVNMWFTNFEWFAQDNWRVNRRLTLDLGLRFYYLPHVYDEGNNLAVFDPAAWDPSKAPALYVPHSEGGRVVARDPRTGAIATPTLIGRLAPDSGDPANGMRIAGQGGLPRGLLEGPGVKLAPRFGFAYDLLGTGRTVLRGGFGMFFDRPQGQPWVETAGQPPIAYTPAQFYGNLSNFTQTGTTLAPSSVYSQVGKGVLPGTMNYSFGIQQQVFGTAIDVSYVGSQSRHLLANRWINPIPMFARLNPANANTVQGGVLPDIFLRPYRGYGEITLREFSTNANYNSLQISANRRFQRGLQFGIAYTWSKVLGMGNSDYDFLSPYFSPRERNYGPLAYDRTHVFVANYIYELPRLSAYLGYKPLGWITDNWMISGITTFMTGAPFTPTFRTVDAADISGSSEAARIDVVGDPRLDKSERTFSRNFRTEAFARPARGTFGNAGVGILRAPGVNNWDITVTKRIPLGGETRFLQFRTEFFNAWNHTQFSGYSTQAVFDAQGRQTDPAFGQYATARDPRLIQLSLRVAF